ncbi:MAG: hypothetical protein A3F68_04270 [Acidobacteria bacterium RIFCSPLOWO2_12_FULL_54_10]|nr:MAG: hypothetical protein A3F68_04270 [Acidobacteria bacterium RIFCSPLOWO2_12_FULL_54_10]
MRSPKTGKMNCRIRIVVTEHTQNRHNSEIIHSHNKNDEIEVIQEELREAQTRAGDLQSHEQTRGRNSGKTSFNAKWEAIRFGNRQKCKVDN